MRPHRLVVVLGTGTEVGKTWVSARLISQFVAEGRSVAVRKPAQSYSPDDERTDAAVLAAASGEDPTVVCPPARWYPVPMAPPMAAQALGRVAPTLGDLVREVTAGWPESPIDVGVVETAGGVASPIATDGDAAALAFALHPDVVVLVADAGLGTINLVRLGHRAMQPLPTVVHLNRFDPSDDLHRRNLEWLTERDRYQVTTSVDQLRHRVSSAGLLGECGGRLEGRPWHPEERGAQHDRADRHQSDPA
jgi:dethiobiotin synthetase